MMKRAVLLLTVCLTGRFSVCAGGLPGASAADLYAQACAERAGGDPKRAIQTAVKVIALCPGETEWLAKSELLCAGLYLELGQTNAAAVTVRQIQNLYAGTDAAKQADALLSKIEGGSGGMSE
jgi:hypothetical protein